MYLQLCFTLVLLFLVSGLIIWFLNEKRIMSLVHTENISVLESAISKNLGQIDYRKHTINKYDLLRYNLQDALISQPEIEL
jgi:hypothetical protein